ncbi:MAG: ParB/RepB/Spo0J family partition protein [Bryobacteraceae bacterium]|nr:ParB/RepB/Spo0J family partition protein [Bryobacteraceae bacterium]
MSKDSERKALGKGLSALLPPRWQAVPKPELPPIESGSIYKVPIDQIQPNPVQPRTIFEPERLNGLAASIRANGIIQPLVVQKVPNGFQLVAGERRWRAARLAGLTEVPVVVQEFASERLLEIALIENIQREDLNPIEVAHALDRLSRDYKLTHEEIASRTGKDRTTVTNLIRLLKLPDAIQLLVAEHRLSMGHARALLSLTKPEQQIELAERAAAQGLSVRQVERLVHTLTQERSGPDSVTSANSGKPATDPNIEAAQREMESTLGTRVRVVAQSADRGKIEIEYYSIEELDRIYNLICSAR